VLEGALRVRQRIRYGSPAAGIRDPMLAFDEQAGVFVPRPGYEIDGGRIHIKINSLGFRGDEFSREKPPGTFRIVCLGASTTFNAESSSNEWTWPHRLQEKLRVAYPGRHIEVINAAVGGYTSTELVKVLHYRVLPLDPDLVIYYEANNEIVKDTRQLAEQEGIAARGPSDIVKKVSNYSLTFDLAYKNVAILLRSRDTSSRKLDSIPATLPDHFIHNLDEMRAELEPRRIRFVLSTFIVKYRRNQDRATQVANADVAFYYMPWMSIDGMLAAVDGYNAAILRYGVEAALPVVDDREAIPADSEHFTDCMHLADKGADAMAGRFARFLASNGLVADAQTKPRPE
jgi:lysophospholipase L1-like esterase